jgi:type II restriction enzyme
MKLEFDEPQSSYTSGSQSARAWTEAWVSTRAYCPHCGNTKMSQFPNNSPLADFLCESCNEELELKSQKGKFGAKAADGAYKTKCERLAASNNPNLLLMNYDLKTLAVVNLLIVPKHFFVRDIIEERKPLAATARRAGWIGSNILLSRVPESGKIHIVQNGIVRPKEAVLHEWQKMLFLRSESPKTRGWLLDVIKCVESLGKREFTLDEVYAFERQLGDLYPGNQNVKPKIRQQLQYLRDRGFIDFVSRGNYRLRSKDRSHGLVFELLQMRPLQTPVDRRMVLHVRRRVPALWRAGHDALQKRGPDRTRRTGWRRVRCNALAGIGRA